MKWLVDTNVWLELLLDQQRAEEVRAFLERTPASHVALTEFTLYSIGIILTRLSKQEAFADFVKDIVATAGVQRVRLEALDFVRLLHVHKQFAFDFDDAYQYVAAETTGMTLVTFDADFDRGERERCIPSRANVTSDN